MRGVTTITVTVHLTLLDARLRSAFGGLENALRFSLERVEEFAIAERAADGLGAAQPFDDIGIDLLGQEIHEIRIALADRRERPITVTVHLILLDARLRSAFGGLENALRFSIEYVEEFAIAERAAECSPAP